MTTAAVVTVARSTAVDEMNRLVKVDAGVVTADLLDYLAGYGSGWTLRASPLAAAGLQAAHAGYPPYPRGCIPRPAEGALAHSPPRPAPAPPATFPWFTFQTVAGAVATASHGSSLAWGSLCARR